MIPEDKLLFICTRQNFLDTHKKAVIDLCDREKINWERVYATAKLHGVAPLIYLNLQKCSGNGLVIPNDIANKFKLYIYTRKILEKEWEDTLKDALDFFHQRSIDVMLVKGVALNALVYMHPWLVNKNDFDLTLVDCFDGKYIPTKLERLDFYQDLKSHSHFVLTNRLWHAEHIAASQAFMNSLATRFDFVKIHTRTNIIISLL